MLTLKSVSIGIGLLLVIFYLPFLFNFKGWKKELLKTICNKDISRVYAIIMMLIGFLALQTYYRFELIWPLAISLIGWLFLLKGLMWFWFPDWVKNTATKTLKKQDWLITLAGLAGLGIGIFYEYIGFYVF